MNPGKRDTEMITQNEAITIIVPVYNAEEFLDICVQSIVEQTHKELEIILVDDGSTDKSPLICDEWAKRDSRVKVIHQSNEGGGKARNAALCVATGNYIGFVDSDDYISPEMYEHLLSLMDDDVDLAECSFVETKDNDAFSSIDKAASEEIELYSTKEAMCEHIKDSRFRQIIWNKLYKRGIVQDVPFVEKKGIDDEYWTYRVIGNAKKLLCTSAILYAYRQQASSVMHNLNIGKRTISAIDAKVARHRYLQEKMPSLVPESLRSIWFSCLYYGQLVLKYKDDVPEIKNTKSFIQETIKQFPIRFEFLKNKRLSEKIWLSLLKISFWNTCRIRNALNIGQ